MVWFLISVKGNYSTHEAQAWLASAVTVAYGILMLLLWPHEKESLER
jgi:hypothetical protein